MNEFDDEITSVINGDADISNNIGANYGIFKIMYYTTPRTTVDNKLRTGSAYTSSGFASAYYYMGMLGCILFAVLCGVLLSLVVNYFLYYLKYNQFIRAFILYKLYTNTIVLLSAFTIFPFFNKTSMIGYIILIICHNKFFTYKKMQL